MGYFYNMKWEFVLDHYKAIGNSALIISGAPIDILPIFEDEMKKAVKEANPDLKKEDYDFITVSHKDNKEENDLEKITKVAGGKLSENTHFYIVTPLKRK